MRRRARRVRAADQLMQVAAFVVLYGIMELIEIQGEKASLFVANSSDDKSYLVWANHSYSFLLSSKLNSDQLIKIAESME